MAKGKGGFIGQDGLNAPDAPTGVSGTAGGSQVTVSWTNPTDVGGSAITGYAISSNPSVPIEPPSLTTASYTSKSFSLESQGSGDIHYAMTFNSDGTKAYFSGYGAASIFQYSLSTAWDISTTSYDSVSLDTSGQTSSGQAGLVFSPDGSKLYMVSYNTDTVYQYTLTTPFDLSTGSYASKSLDISSQDNNPQDMYIKSDGTKLYVLGDTNNSIFQYTMSTPFDLSTASYDSVSFATTTQQTNPTGLFFSSDGTIMLVCGYTPAQADKYILSTPWVVSSASHDSSYTLSEFSGEYPNAIFAGNDLNNLFVSGGVSGNTVGKVFQYAVGMPTGSPFVYGGLTNGTSYTFNVWAINAFGWSVASDPSSAVSPVAPVHGLMSYDSNGSAANKLIYVNIVTLGSASDFGAIGPEYNSRATGSSSTRAIVAGGQNSGGNAQNAITYTTIGTTGTGSDFGDLTVSRTAASGISNSTRMVIANGDIISSRSNVMDYITIASTGNATDFGDSNSARYHASSTQSTTRGLIIGGRDGSLISDVRYITIASTGDSAEFGNAAPDGDGTGYGAAFSNGTRAVSAYGYKGSFVNSADMGYITIASTGNMTDYGDLTGAGYGLDATSSSTRGIIGHVGFGLGIDYFTISSTGNGTDFGDLPTGSSDSNGFLGSGNMGGDHGGL